MPLPRSGEIQPKKGESSPRWRRGDVADPARAHLDVEALGMRIGHDLDARRIPASSRSDGVLDQGSAHTEAMAVRSHPEVRQLGVRVRSQQRIHADRPVAGFREVDGVGGDVLRREREVATPSGDELVRVSPMSLGLVRDRRQSLGISGIGLEDLRVAAAHRYVAGQVSSRGWTTWSEEGAGNGCLKVNASSVGPFSRSSVSFALASASVGRWPAGTHQSTV